MVCWAIVRTDGGSGFFLHERIGRDGRRFHCIKLRSMIPDAEQHLVRILQQDKRAAAEWSSSFKLQNDPRVTRIGRFLRRTSLDELPQLWNVLRGDMSLVGPRPITERELFYYDPDPGAYLNHAPGVTGLWQVEGRSDASYQRRVRLDRQYASSCGFWTDLGLMVRTVGCMLRRTGT